MLKSEIKFKKFKKAFLALEAIYQNPPQKDRINVDATIQRFEFTFELVCKLLKDYFVERDLELNYPKEIIQQAFMLRLIDDEDLWVKMLRDRNMTSHTYDEKLADEIYYRIKLYVPLLRSFLNTISANYNS